MVYLCWFLIFYEVLDIATRVVLVCLKWSLSTCDNLPDWSVDNGEWMQSPKSDSPSYGVALVSGFKTDELLAMTCGKPTISRSLPWGIPGFATSFWNQKRGPGWPRPGIHNGCQGRCKKFSVRIFWPDERPGFAQDLFRFFPSRYWLNHDHGWSWFIWLFVNPRYLWNKIYGYLES